MPNANALLKADHVTVRKLLRELEGTTERGVKVRERLVSDIEREIKIHSQIEEALFYLTFKKAAEDTESEELFYEATEEHHVFDMVLPVRRKSESVEGPHRASRAARGGADVRAGRRLLDDEQLRVLGEELQACKKTLQAMWSNPILEPVRTLQSAVHKITPAKIKNAKANAIVAMKSDEARQR